MEPQAQSKILIVDDDPMNVYILKEILGSHYELSTADTGEEALKIAEEFKADLILLDIMMPDLDGYELCRRFRENQSLAFTKIILVSAKSMLKDRLEGYKTGADDYITKPFDPEELKAKVAVFLRLKSVEEIERVKDDIINVFSHETRTPLNAIIGFSRILEESADLPEVEREAVIHIRESGRELMEMVEKTILLSNLRKGGWALRPRRVSLRTLVDIVEVKLTGLLEEESISINNQLEADLILEMDEELMVTAVAFVMDNAVKFSPEGSSLKISAERDERGLYLNIRDYGKGVPEDKLKTLFTEFLVEDVTHHGRGHGLGLSIVYHVMKLHGGDVQARNNPDGIGCTFVLFFPRNLIPESLGPGGESAV